MFAVNIGLLMFTSTLTGTTLSKEDFVPETSLCLFTPSSIHQPVFKRKTNAGFALLGVRRKMSSGKARKDVMMFWEVSKSLTAMKCMFAI